MGNQSITKPKPVLDIKPRKCLCCGQKFKSEWSGNRICSSCKATDAYRLPEDYTTIQQGTGGRVSRGRSW